MVPGDGCTVAPQVEQAGHIVSVFLGVVTSTLSNATDNSNASLLDHRV